MEETRYIGSSKDLPQWSDLRIFTGPELALSQKKHILTSYCS